MNTVKDLGLSLLKWDYCRVPARPVVWLTDNGPAPADRSSQRWGVFIATYKSVPPRGRLAGAEQAVGKREGGAEKTREMSGEEVERQPIRRDVRREGVW